MGRAYQDELGELNAAASRLPARNLDRFREIVDGSCHGGIIVVASGGARVVAEWFCLLHLLQFGRAATSLTPLQYAALREPIEGVTWFVSAGGSHADIMLAAQACVNSGSRRAAALIGRPDSALSQFLNEHGHTHIVSLDHPAKLDGFLATNSIWSMALAVAYAYRVSFFDSFRDLTETSRSMLAWAELVALASLPLRRPESSLVLLHDGWTWLGALDFEIRLIEASLQRIWRADFRNFGHGRHYWLADRGAESEVIALAASGAKELATSTLSELPPDIPSQTVMLPYDGAAAALASVAWSIYRVGALGVTKSRDPGRPGVPAFGERLYEGRYRWPDSKDIPSAFTLALARKIGRSTCQSLRDAEREQWRLAYARFVDRLSTTSIQGVVFDFDGTLVDTERRFDPIEPPIVQMILALLKARIPIGIATGRGDSAYNSLVNAISDEFREHVIVGYHNGADVRKLSERADDLDEGSVSPKIAAAAALLEERLGAFGGGLVRSGTTQCTIAPSAGLALETLWAQCSDLLQTALPASGLKVLVSSHSIDITVSFASKLRVVEAVAKTANCTSDDILRIGDKGAWPGNDCELLKAPLGVSVDECSLDPDTCWNLASRSCFGPRATAELFANMKTTEQGIELLLKA